MSPSRTRQRAAIAVGCVVSWQHGLSDVEATVVEVYDDYRGGGLRRFVLAAEPNGQGGTYGGVPEEQVQLLPARPASARWRTGPDR